MMTVACHEWGTLLPAAVKFLEHEKQGIGLKVSEQIGRDVVCCFT